MPFIIQACHADPSSCQCKANIFKKQILSTYNITFFFNHSTFLFFFHQSNKCHSKFLRFGRLQNSLDVQYFTGLPRVASTFVFAIFFSQTRAWEP